MTSPNWAKNFLFLLVYTLSGLVLVIIIQGLLSGTELIPLNTAIEKLMVHIRTPILTTLMVTITRLGNPFTISSSTVLLAAILLIRRRYYDAALFVVALIVSVISFTILKNTFQITRPVSDIVTSSGWSFPSGHATVATTFFFMLAYSFFGRLESVKGKFLLSVMSVLGAGLICLSRLYLGAHWTLDILAGIALGFLSVSFTILLFNILIENRRSIRGRMSL